MLVGDTSFRLMIYLVYNEYSSSKYFPDGLLPPPQRFYEGLTSLLSCMTSRPAQTVSTDLASINTTVGVSLF